MLTILGRYDLETVIAASRPPWMVVQAMVSFEDKDKAKAKGFRWESEAGRTYKKCWVKRIPLPTPAEVARGQWPRISLATMDRMPADMAMEAPTIHLTRRSS